MATLSTNLQNERGPWLALPLTDPDLAQTTGTSPPAFETTSFFFVSDAHDVPPALSSGTSPPELGDFSQASFPSATALWQIPPSPTITQFVDPNVPRELSALVQQPPRPYEPLIGQSEFSWEDFFQSQSRLVDNCVTIANDLGLDIERPLGESRDVIVPLVFIAWLIAWQIPLDNVYGRRMDNVGREALKSRLAYHAVGILGFYMIERLGVDAIMAYLRHDHLSEVGFDDLSTQVTFNLFPVIALFAAPWGLVTLLAESLYGPALSGLDAARSHACSAFAYATKSLPGISSWLSEKSKRRTSHKPSIRDGENFYDPTLKTLDKIRTQNATGARLNFTVDAEHLTKLSLTQTAADLSLAPTEIRARGMDRDKLETLAPLLKLVRSLDGNAAEIVVHHAENVTNRTVRPGDGKVLQGSVVQVAATPDNPSGRHKLKTSVVPTLATGDIIVIKGTVEKETRLSDLTQAYRFTDAVYDVIFSGPAATLIPLVAEGIVSRELSDALLPTAILPRILRKTIFRPLLNLIPATEREALRRAFVRTPLEVSLAEPQNAGSRFHEAVLQLAAEERYLSVLAESPRVPLSATLVDFLRNETGEGEITLRLKKQDMPHALKDLQPSASQMLKKSWTKDGYAYVTLDAGDFFTALKANPAALTKLARAQNAEIVLDNPARESHRINEFLAAEKLALRVPPGCDLSLQEFYDRHEPAFYEAAYWRRAANEIIRGSAAYRLFWESPFRSAGFGRLASIAVFTLAMGAPGSAVVAIETALTGFKDLSLIGFSSLRSLAMTFLNQLFAAGIQSAAGEASFTKNKFWMPSMLGLAVLEIINKPKEAYVTQYDEHVQELGGEDRPEVRLKKVLRLAELESDIERVQPGGVAQKDKVRKAILYKRLANLVWTDFSAPRDARLLREIYDENRGSAPNFEAEFLTALWLDTALKDAVFADEAALAFFITESEAHEGEIVKELARLRGEGLRW